LVTLFVAVLGLLFLAVPGAQAKSVNVPAGASSTGIVAGSNTTLPDGSSIAVATADDVTPADWSECQVNVCIYVYGSGLTVDDWGTSLNFQSTGCTYANFWINGSLYARAWVCGTKGVTTTVWLANTPLKFSGQADLCNTWTDYSGKPCASVHS